MNAVIGIIVVNSEVQIVKKMHFDGTIEYTIGTRDDLDAMIVDMCRLREQVGSEVPRPTAGEPAHKEGDTIE
jgi:hypothetical protein